MGKLFIYFHKSASKLVLNILGLFMFFSSGLLAQHHEEHHEHHAHNNHVGIFMGSTAQYNNGRHLYTLGLDYTRFLNHRQNFGISSFLEVFFSDEAQWLGGVPIVYKPSKNLILRSGPGIELVRDSNNKIKGHFVLRTGVAYDIHLKHLTITPSFDLDYVRYHPSMVWGVTLGKGF